MKLVIASERGMEGEAKRQAIENRRETDLHHCLKFKAHGEESTNRVRDT